MIDLHPSPIAGTWYKGNPKALAARVDEYLSAANLPEIKGEVIAVIAPHVGHFFSGAVAAHAFTAVRDLTPDLIADISEECLFLKMPSKVINLVPFA